MFLECQVFGYASAFNLVSLLWGEQEGKEGSAACTAKPGQEPCRSSVFPVSVISTVLMTWLRCSLAWGGNLRFPGITLALLAKSSCMLKYIRWFCCSFLVERKSEYMA